MITKELEANMIKSVEASQRNFNTIRTGRANTSLLDRLTVEYYGADTPLKSLATLSTPDSQTISIQPFDISSLSLIEKAISLSDLGFTPNNDGKIIRINIPPLTEERRKEFCKLASKYAEEAKVSLRNIRRDAIEKIKTAEKEGEISKDQSHDQQETVQKLTNKFINEIEKNLSKKESEILKV
ncbi:ribosome recycling factor [Prochlorococcus marinus]|uniref:ribosome recycling factor n=1 Tax=Prochlorococcus marinus TaxID=1219 RepID=UPI0022B5B6C4|nr:ribosome recycling factor [Prochlorococcus marinus]